MGDPREPLDEMLTAVEMDILVDLLVHGDNTPSNLADNTGRHKTSVSQRLPELEERDLVRNKGRGVWSLTEPGANMAVSIRSDRAADGETNGGSNSIKEGNFDV